MKLLILVILTSILCGCTVIYIDDPLENAYMKGYAEEWELPIKVFP